MASIVVTEEGERHDSERVRRQAGAFAIAGVHYAYDQFAQYGRRPPPHMAEFWDDYVALVEDAPAEIRHQRVHQGHNCWVVPEEEQFVTAALIDRSCLVGTPSELAERIVALDAAGLDHFVVLPPLDAKEAVIRDIAAQVMPLLG